MSAPRADDILFATGGDWLTRYGVPFLRRRFDGSESSKYTHARADASTCASYFDRDGILRYAAANKLRCAWDYARTAPRLLLENAATNLVAYSENLGAWSLGGSPVRTSGQSDPWGGTAAYLLQDDDAGVTEYLNLAVTFTADGTKTVSVFMKAGTAAISGFSIFDNTAATHRHRVKVTWSGGVPTLSTDTGNGVLFPVEPLAGGWYRLKISAASVVAANTNWVVLYPADPSSASAQGTVYAIGAQAENAVVPSSYIKTSGSTVTRAADALQFPIGFGVPQSGDELSMYIKASVDWLPITGGIALAPGLGVIGYVSPFAADGLVCWDVYPDTSGNNMIARLTANGVSQTATAARPTTGTDVELVAQLRASGASHAPYLELANGNTATGTALALAGYRWAESRIRPGARGNATSPGTGFTAVDRLWVARGRFSLAEMQAAPLP